MNSENITVHQKDQPIPSQEDPGHAEAVAFVEKHRDILEHYARGKLKIEPAPAGLDTFAFDLEKNTVYINSRFYKQLGFSEERTYFATCHEIEHFLEKVGLLAEPAGQRTFQRYLDRIKADKAFSLMDNCVADIRENRAVVMRNPPEIAAIEQGMYREDLFPSDDLTKSPRHIQFCEALLNESRVPNRVMKVAPEVRTKLDELKKIKNRAGASLIEAMTVPNVPMSMRLRLQDHFIWPMVKELLDKDIDDKKKEKKEKSEGKDKKGKGGKGEGEQKPEPGGIDPNKAFGDDYNEAEKRIPNAVRMDKIEKAFKDWQAQQGENPLDRADREYAEKLGVKPEDLRQYREIVESLNKIVNPETGARVIEELRDLFNRIIARRLKPSPGPRYPVEEGEDLVDPAGLVSGVKGGNLEPKVWETTETIERPGPRFGEVEITLVCDRSGSMKEGTKLPEQRKAAALIMEALKEFNDLCREEQFKLTRPLEIRSEIYSFQATNHDAVPLKAMSPELGERERVDVAGVLSSAPGQRTTDFVTLETIDQSLGEDRIKKIRDGELKKIVIVFTDGISHGPDRVKAVLGKMRGLGIAAIGVGITEAGAPAVETYAPDARLAEKAEDLAKVLSDLLKEHLSDL